jgi:putative oxidoreductase
MTTAIRHVHAAKGPWNSDGGWEYNAVLIAAALAIVEDESGLGWALAAGAAGAAGSFVLSKRSDKPAEDVQPVAFHAAEQVREPAQP